MKTYLIIIAALLAVESVSAQEMFFFETIRGTAKASIEDGKLVQSKDIEIVMPPQAGPVKFTSDERGPKVIFTLVEHPPENWIPKCVVGDDILISQWAVERPKLGGEGPTLLVLRHNDAKIMAWWGNNLADFMRSRFHLLRYTPTR
jgi:hypothetical protein